LIALIAVSLFVVSIIVGIAVVMLLWKRKKTAQTAETNYRIFFIMGIVLIAIGLSLMVVSTLADFSTTIGFPFFIIGVIYLGIGLGNRSQWNKK
jgi:uncharacterized membrane protein